jgi:hypothetical protein
MNPWLADALAESRAREMRHGAAQYRRHGAQYRRHAAQTTWTGEARYRRNRPARDRALAAGLRGRVGYALVEAGLHMLATAGPAGGSGA